MVRLAQLHLRHPIEDFARIEVAKNSALEFQQQRRMNGIRKIEQNVRSGEAIDQLTFGNSDAIQRVQVVRVDCCLLAKQTVSASESECAQLPLEVLDLRLISLRIFCSW